MLKEQSFHISAGGSRRGLREQVVYEFLKEEPGAGTKELTSKYNYYVETLKDGRRIFLARPAILNKGFDFVVRVESTNFNTAEGKARNNPTHTDVINDLLVKRTENPERYGELFGLIEKVHACQEVSSREYEHINFQTGYATDLVLLVIKWLFIEQDITYWNFSGRNMFMSKIPPPE